MSKRIASFSMLSGIWICLFSYGSFAQDNTAQKPNGPERASVSFRIGLGQSMPEKRFSELLDLFDKYKGVTDEITFFTSITHPPIPLKDFKERTEVLKQRIGQARRRGYRAGINVLSTLGHHQENSEYSLKGNFTRLTALDGTITEGAYCPNDPALREYITEIYAETAKADPDYIWLDDDIRLASHGPVSHTCFCHRCLAKFNARAGTGYDRNSLKKSFDEGPPESKLKAMNEWISHNREVMNDLFRLIEATVHRIRPNLPLGFMTGDRFYEGYDFMNWASTLAGPKQAPVYWRPGGGFYHDTAPTDLFSKSHDIGRQVSLLPPEVSVIQSEIENFPYQRLKKAAGIVSMEVASYIAAGCTGAAFNVLSFYDEPLDEYEPLLARLQKARPFYDRMVRELGRDPAKGVSVVWNPNSFVTLNTDSPGSWLSGGSPVFRPEMYEIGIPASYSYKNATVSLLEKDAVLALTEDEITDLLSRSVYMSAEALDQLNRMGFSDLTGFEVTDMSPIDRIERLSDHSLNGLFSGWLRDNRQSFWKSNAYTLKPASPNAIVMSDLTDYSGKSVGECTMGIFENRLGGRICVAGYYPWTFMGSLSKSHQVKSVFRWLGKDQLPGLVASFHKTTLWIREPEAGHLKLALANSSLDAAEQVELLLRTTDNRVSTIDMDGNEELISAISSDGPYKRFVIPRMEPMQMKLIRTE